MKSPECERIAFFDGQLLTASVFRADQRYFEQLIAERHAALHSAGIVRGLTLSLTVGPKNAVNVNPGMAIDDQGRPLFLDKPKSLDLGHRRGTELYVLLALAERPDPASASSQYEAQGFKRFLLEPRIKLVEKGEAQREASIVLGKLTIDDDGKVEIDPNTRAWSGVRVGQAAFVLDGTDPEPPSLCASVDKEEPRASALEVSADQVSFTGALKITGTLTVSNALGLDSPTLLGGLPGEENLLGPAPRDWPKAQLDVTGAGGPLDKVLFVGTEANTSPGMIEPVLALTCEGNLGVGVEAPTAKLEVDGDLLLDGDKTIFFGEEGSLRGPKGETVTFRKSGLKVAVPWPLTITLQTGGDSGSKRSVLEIFPDRVNIDPSDQVASPDAGASLDAMLNVEGAVQSLRGGFLIGTQQTPQTTAHPTLPIGTVIDWWSDPSSPTQQCPENFQLCDGETVYDKDSPLHGRAVPDLRRYFVLGTTDARKVGKTEDGAHRHKLGIPPHKHSVDHGHGGPLAFASGEASTTSPSRGGGSNGLSGRKHTHMIDVTVNPTSGLECDESAIPSGELQTGPPVAAGSAEDEGSPPVGSGSDEVLPPHFDLLKIIRIK